MTAPQRLGFFSRLLDEAAPAERYRLATEQIVHAEANGYNTAWVAQHHFNGSEGGLPAPLVFLAHAAAKTTRIRLATGIITLPLEQPVRVAEDAAVLDALSGGRLEIGVGSGGTPTSFTAFGQDSTNRSATFGDHLAILRTAWRGDELDGGSVIYPPAPALSDRIWQATFSTSGGARAGAASDGVMLSRTQPRSEDHPRASLSALQEPIIDAYLGALPSGTLPRIGGSRSLFVADDRGEARRFAEAGLRSHAGQFGTHPSDSLDELIRAFDVHVGTPDDVITSLAADTALARATDIIFQVHSVDPPHEHILRSIELTAQLVAPALGWSRSDRQDALTP